MVETPEVESVKLPAGLTPEMLEVAKLLLEEQRAADEAKSAEEEDHDTVCRELEIVPNRAFGTFMIRRKGGGKIPSILQGHWLDYALAERNLEAYKQGILKPQGKWADKIQQEKERLMREKSEADKLANEIKKEKNALDELRAELEEVRKLKAEIAKMKENLKKSA